MSVSETPQQRDRARTIFERSVEGRRAATLPPARTCPRRRSTS